MQTKEMQHVPHVSGCLRQLPVPGPLAGQVAHVVGCRRWKVAVVAEPTIMTIEILSACNRNPNEERGAFKDY